MTVFQQRLILLAAAALLFVGANYLEGASQSGLLVLAGMAAGTLKRGPGHVKDE